MSFDDRLQAAQAAMHRQPPLEADERSAGHICRSECGSGYSAETCICAPCSCLDCEIRAAVVAGELPTEWGRNV